jgi:hypothetical protein
MQSWTISCTITLVAGTTHHISQPILKEIPRLTHPKAALLRAISSGSSAMTLTSPAWTKPTSSLKTPTFYSTSEKSFLLLILSTLHQPVSDLEK